LNRLAWTSLGLSLSFAAGAAAAQQAAPPTVSVSGQAARLCRIGAPKVQVGSAVNLGAVDGQTINISSLADSATLSTKAISFDIDFDALCNFSHAVQLSSDRGGLWRVATGAASSATFADGVPYHATLVWAGTQSTLEASAASVAPKTQVLDVNSPAGGALVVQFRVDSGATDKGAGVPLAAGTYQDTLTVTLGPQ
jgi:hypothetical protein